MNDDMFTAIIVGIVFILSIFFPIIGTLFLAVMLLTALINVWKFRKVAGQCTECAFFDSAKDVCIYYYDGECKEDCDNFKMLKRGGEN